MLTIQAGDSDTFTITKSDNLKDTDLVVSIEAEGVTPSIDQTTGVVTISVDSQTPSGEYVATVTCGDAEPLEITITVTVPTTTEVALYFQGRPAESWSVGRLGQGRKFGVLRLPANSTTAFTYELSSQADKFTIVAVQNLEASPSEGEITVTQNTATDPRETINLTITCGSGEYVLPINPK